MASHARPRSTNQNRGLRRVATLALLLTTSAFAASAAFAPWAHAQTTDGALVLEPDYVIDPAVLEALLAEGAELADSGDHLQASLRFHDILQNGEEGTVQVMEAQYALGVSLLELGLSQSALGVLEGVVYQGDAHPKYRKALPLLLRIARQTGAEANVASLLGEYDPALYPPDFSDELHFLVGQFLYGEGDLLSALDRFGQISEASDAFYVRGKYLEGVIHVQLSRLGEDAAQKRGDVDTERLGLAAESFKAVLRFERDEGSDEVIAKIAGMAHLALGRLFFSTRQYDTAVRYYDRVAEQDGRWLDALFEVSWVYFQLKNYPRALGNLHTLNSPYFADQYFPESRVLQALILFYGCRYDEADAVVKEFVQEFYPLMTELKEEINQFADPNAFYAWLATLSQSDSTEYSTRFKRIFNAALADRKLRRKFFFVSTLGQELARLTELRASASDAGALLDELDGDLTAYRSLVIGEAGSLAQARLLRVLKELKQHLSAALRIKGETLKARRGVLADSIRAEQQGASTSKVTIEVDREHIEWPFTGEYWKDELGSYIYDVPSKCERAAAE